MGFETTVVVAIFFLSAMILGTTSYVVISASEDIVDDASYEKNEMQIKRLQTDILIDYSNPTGSSTSYDLTVSISNTGSETLRSDELDILIDGTIQSCTFLPTTITWTPDEIKTLSVTGLSGAGSHRVKVVTENGVSDYDTYTVS
ncbi:MAG TPA: hypothetical protein C5S51_07700 [Methanosarcinaceae archaeon]|nr:hypothetical protein [Methanosarcinaceae archaeon]